MSEVQQVKAQRERGQGTKANEKKKGKENNELRCMRAPFVVAGLLV
jgi:hypothetical protein